MRTRRHLFLCCLHFAVVTIAIPAARDAVAQAYPRQPVRVIVPFAAGGGADIIARLVAQKLNGLWAQPVVVDNRAGGNTIIGTDLAAKSKADGYTLFVAVSAHTINPALYPKLPYNTAADFAPVTLLSRYPYVLTSHPSVPAKTVRELIALAKARPGEMSYATSGNGSPVHLGFELFKSMAGGIDIVHVPYKGAAPANADLVGGHVQLFFNNFVAAMPLIKAGRLRVIAVTSAKRSHVMPNIPTMAESGVPGLDVTGWNGILVPAETPEAIVLKLYSDIASTLRNPEVAARLSSEGSDPGGDTPEDFGRFLYTETLKWAKVVKEAGIKVE